MGSRSEAEGAAIGPVEHPPAVVVVIPAYQPDERLLDVLRALAPSGIPVVVVNDGSAEASNAVFAEAARMPMVDVVGHAVNLGKGAALRTGFNHVLCRYPGAAIVTADADGQHAPEDILQVARQAQASPDALVLGVREFDRNTPWRSRFGNQMTGLLFGLLQGVRLRDTQTGLRGVPRKLAEAMLRATASGYEFELDMLIVARRMSLAIRQVPIRTLYIDGNASSHFNPLLDSMRIYFVLLRFGMASALTALCDNVVFWAGLAWLASPLQAQIAGRLVAVLLYFHLNRRLVFLFRKLDTGVVVRYLGVVAVSGTISYLSLMSVHEMFGAPLVWAKLGIETILFLANFLLLRDFVFARPEEGNRQTDWTAYYKSVPWTAKLTRKYTTARIVGALRRAGFGDGTTVCEFGGGNSCFLDAMVEAFRPKSYHVVDTNALGLDLLREKRQAGTAVLLHRDDAMAFRLEEAADLVFSVGLIEHFDTTGTREVVSSHFANARPGGLVVLSAPRPTWLYRATRWLLERASLWKFPDERPLNRDEWVRAASEWGDLVWEETLWPLLLTQHLAVFRRRTV